MTTKKIYEEAYHDYEEFLLKTKQYRKAVHSFHDHSSEFNNSVDELSLTEMETSQKEFICRERELHDVMDSFERTAKAYKEKLARLKPLLKGKVQILIKGKEIELSMVKGDLRAEQV